MNKSKKLVCAGVGQLNQRIATLWQQQQLGSVAGLRRSQSDAALAFPQVQVDLAMSQWPDLQADVLVIALSAQERSVEGYMRAYVEPIKQLQRSLADWQSPPKQVLVVSSTRVYPQQKGEWVDDMTQTLAKDALAQVLIDMEQLASSLPIPVSIIRLSGVYGPGRDWLKRMALSLDQTTGFENNWTNRIHIDDAAAAIVFLAQQRALESSYLVSDLEPQSKLTMFNYFRKQVGLPLIEPDLDEGAPCGKRIIPNRLRALGFQWQYPHAFSGGYEA